MAADIPRLQLENPSALPPGTRLGEFELLGLLGVGGFGIVYLAFDHALEREIAVKEYMPATLAGRTETMHVSLRSQSDAETFALGLKSFVNEAKMLARFDHPSLLKVHRFWEANGTAYMAMPVMRGRTVKEVRAEMTAPPDEAWLRALLEPLLGAIEKLHSEGVYHRDIAPDNIQIEPGGRPVLLDFGAARRVISDKSQTLTAILKPAYAPIEQYAEAGSVKQGPWTDIYALGATLHYLLLGRPPAPATARAVHDDASALTTLSLPGCSETFLRTIDWMLAPRPSDRPQSVAALREVLDGHAKPPLRRSVEPLASQWDRTVLMPAAAAPMRTDIDFGGDDEATRVIPPPAMHAVQPAAAAHPAAAPTLPPLSAPPVSHALSAPAAPPSRSRLLPLGLAGAAAAVVIAAVALWPRQAAQPPVPAESPAEPPASAAAALPAPPPAASVPESAIATVVVPGGKAAGVAPAAAAAVTAADTLPAHAAATEKPATAAPSAKRPSAPASHNLAVAPQPPAPTAAAQPEPPPQAAKPAPAVPAVAESPKPAPAPKPVASGPEATCSGKNPVLYFVCMERECLRAENLGTADCQAWRKNARHD